MSDDFTRYHFARGEVYEIEIENVAEAVRLAHHGEGRMEPQSHYPSLEYATSVGSGPWREFFDRENETVVSIDSHHIVAVRASPEGVSPVVSRE
ncbi:MAG TPA: hypothetical protein VMQ46_03690 [Acidimicrobiia bacterium]|nr:hypothetical protein [Acidimicrobiia bacterium]